MSKYRRFNIQDLYPADYRFDYEAFAADPESYIFTADDIAFFNAMELEKYEREVPMSPYEKRLLRKWVMSGHSPYENPGSKYLYLPEPDPYDFLDVYRMDRDLRREMKGMTKSEKEAYLKDCMGWTDEPEYDSQDDSLTFDDTPFDTDSSHTK